METEKKMIVLDDDPTGIQTVHDIYVYTDWSVKSMREGFLSKEKMFFILTNSRAFTEEKTKKVHQEIVKNIIKASKECSKEFILISRGDSTLRGHYPLEMDVIADELHKAGKSVDGEFLIPFFKEGGRFTQNDIHYVEINGTLVEAAQTEFAEDKTFGYKNSDLKSYIEEKTKGKYTAKQVVSISLQELIEEKDEELIKKLLLLNNRTKTVVNAVAEEDIRVLCSALYAAMEQGKTYIFRTAASFVKIFGNVEEKPLLTTKELFEEKTQHGGLIIAGSHTDKTTRQLEQLKETGRFTEIEFHVGDGKEQELAGEKDRVMTEVEYHLKQGRSVVVYTSRTFIVQAGEGKEEALRRSVGISRALKDVVEELKVKPKYIVAKGGITSSDIGVKALHVKKAFVLGQIRPAVAVWKTGVESKFPQIPYVIFPGNVGEDDTLKEVALVLEEG